MEYKVPQDVQREDKIIGPFSLKQFLYLIAASMAGYLSYSLISKITESAQSGAIVGIFLFAIIGAFAVIEIHGMSLPDFVVAFIIYSLRPRKRIWQKDIFIPEIAYVSPKVKEEEISIDPSEMKSQLEKLSYVLDTRGWTELEENQEKEEIETIYQDAGNQVTKKQKKELESIEQVYQEKKQEIVSQIQGIEDKPKLIIAEEANKIEEIQEKEKINEIPNEINIPNQETEKVRKEETEAKQDLKAEISPDLLIKENQSEIKPAGKEAEIPPDEEKVNIEPIQEIEPETEETYLKKEDLIKRIALKPVEKKEPEKMINIKKTLKRSVRKEPEENQAEKENSNNKNKPNIETNKNVTKKDKKYVEQDFLEKELVRIEKEFLAKKKLINETAVNEPKSNKKKLNPKLAKEIKEEIKKENEERKKNFKRFKKTVTEIEKIVETPKDEKNSRKRKIIPKISSISVWPFRKHENAEQKAAADSFNISLTNRITSPRIERPTMNISVDEGVLEDVLADKEVEGLEKNIKEIEEAIKIQKIHQEKPHLILEPESLDYIKKQNKD